MELTIRSGDGAEEKADKTTLIGTPSSIRLFGVLTHTELLIDSRLSAPGTKRVGRQ